MSKAKRKSVTFSSKLEVHNAETAGTSGCSYGHPKKTSPKQAAKASFDVQPDLDLVSGFAFLSFASLAELEAHLAANEIKTTTLSLTVGQKRKSTIGISSERFKPDNVSQSAHKKVKEEKSKQENQPSVVSKSKPSKKPKSKYSDLPTEITSLTLEKNYTNIFEKFTNREVNIAPDEGKNGGKTSNVFIRGNREGSCSENARRLGTNANGERARPADKKPGSERKNKKRNQTSSSQTRFRIKKKPKQTGGTCETNTSNKVGKRVVKSQEYGEKQKYVHGEEMLLCTENLTGFDKLEADMQPYPKNIGNVSETIDESQKLKRSQSQADMQKRDKKPVKRPKIEKIEWCARSGGFHSLQKYRLLNKKDCEPAVTCKDGQQYKTLVQFEKTDGEEVILLKEENVSGVEIHEPDSTWKSENEEETPNVICKTIVNCESELELSFSNRTDIDSSIASDSIEDYSGSDIELSESQESRDKDRMLGSTLLTITQASDDEEDVDVLTVSDKDELKSYLVVNSVLHATCDGPVGHFSRHPEATIEGTVDVAIQAYSTEIEVYMKYALMLKGRIVKIITPDNNDGSGVAPIPKCLRDPDKVKSVRSFTERKRRHAIGHLFNGIKSQIFSDDGDSEMYISKQTILDKAILMIVNLQRDGLALCKRKVQLKKKNEKLANRMRELTDKNLTEHKTIDSVEFKSAISKVSLEKTTREMKELGRQLEKKSKFWKQFKETKLADAAECPPYTGPDVKLEIKQERRDVYSTQSTPSITLGRNSRASDELKMALGIKPLVIPSKSSAKPKPAIDEGKATESKIPTRQQLNIKSRNVLAHLEGPKNVAKKTSDVKNDETPQEKIVCNLSRLVSIKQDPGGTSNFRVVTNVYSLKEMESKNVMHIKITKDVLSKLQGEAGKQAVGKQLDQVEQLPDKDPNASNPGDKKQTPNPSSKGMDGKTKEQGKQQITDINLEKSYTTSLLQQLQKISDCDLEPANGAVHKSGADTKGIAKYSPCQSSSELKTPAKFGSSCEDMPETSVQRAGGCSISLSEAGVPQAASTESPGVAALPQSMTDLLKKVAHTTTSIQHSPGLLEQRPNAQNFPAKIKSLNPVPGPSALQTTGDELSSVALDGQCVLAKGSISIAAPLMKSYTSSGMAHSAVPVSGNVISIQPARVTQARVVEGSTVQLSSSAPTSQLPGNSTVSQTMVVKKVDNATKSVFHNQGRTISEHPVPQVKVRPIAPSQHIPQHLLTSSSTATNVSVTRTGQFVVGSPIIIKSMSSSTPGHPIESILKKLIIQPPNTTSNVVLSQPGGTSALNSPVVRNVAPSNIPFTHVAGPVQAANQRNVPLQRTIQVGPVRPGNHLVNPASKVQLSPRAQLEVGIARTVAPVPLQSSLSSLIALNPRSLGNQRNQGMAEQALGSSQTTQVNQAVIQSASQVPSLSAFEVSHIGSQAATLCSPTPQANPSVNHQILQSYMQNQASFPSCMQSTSTAATRPSCMQVALHVPTSSTQVNQLLSSAQSQGNYHVTRGTAQPHMQVTSQMTIQGSLPVNITRHLTPVNLPVTPQKQANPVVTLQQYPRGSRLPYSVPAQVMLKSVPNILPYHAPNPVSSLDSSIQPSFVCDEMIDDLSDVRNIINNLPVPTQRQPTIPSTSSVGASHNTVPTGIGSCLAGTTTQSRNLSALSATSTRHTIPSSFDKCVVNTPMQSSNLAALSEVTSQFAVPSSIGVVAANLQTGQAADKNFNYDSFMSSSLPQIQQSSDSNQTATNFLEDLSVREILGNVEQGFGEQHSGSSCDIEQCVSELFTGVTQESVPQTSNNQNTDSRLGL